MLDNDGSVAAKSRGTRWVSHLVTPRRGTKRRRYQDARAFLSIVIATLATVAFASTLVTVVPGMARAQGVTTEYGWMGYDGNSAIYPTLYQTAVYPSTVTYGYGTNNVSSGFGDIPNALIDGWSTESGYLPVYFYAPGPEAGTGQFEIFLFVSVAGGSQMAPNTLHTGPEYEAGALATSLTYTGLGSTEAGTMLEEYNQVQENSTVGNIGTQSKGDVANYLDMMSLALDAGALLFPVVGVPLAVAGVTLDLAGALGGYSNSAYGLTSTAACSPPCSAFIGDGSISEISQIQNGTFRASDKPNWGWNVFAQGFEAYTTIAPSYLSAVTSGTVLMNSQLQIWNTESSGSYLDGAQASTSYLIAPAISIGGVLDLYSGGPADADGTITLEQTNPSGGQTDFELTTSSTGYWHFFGQPGDSYTLYAPATNGLGTVAITQPLPVSATSDATEGSTDTSLDYSIGAGVMSGSVTNESNGEGISGATVTVYDDGGEDGQDVTTNSAGGYSIMIPVAATSSSPFKVVVSAGSKYYANQWSLTNVPLGTTTTENFELEPDYTSGTGGGGCVASGTPILTASGYVQVQNIKPNESIVEYNVTSGLLTRGLLVSANSTKVSELIDVNSGLLYLTPTDQPIFIRNASYEGWLHDPQNLTTRDQMLDPVTGVWVNVTSVELVDRSTMVYDVISTNLNDFIGASILLDAKTP